MRRLNKALIDELRSNGVLCKRAFGSGGGPAAPTLALALATAHEAGRRSTRLRTGRFRDLQALVLAVEFVQLSTRSFSSSSQYVHTISNTQTENLPCIISCMEIAGATFWFLGDGDALLLGDKEEFCFLNIL